MFYPLSWQKLKISQRKEFFYKLKDFFLVSIIRQIDLLVMLKNGWKKPSVLAALTELQNNASLSGNFNFT